MSLLINTNSFKMTKKEALNQGILIRSRFLDVVQKFAQEKKTDLYPHDFIFGYPGIGKTYEITNILKNSGLHYVSINGNISMYSFGIQLAVINYLNTNQEKIIIFCDDVDALVSTEMSCNILKSALHQPKTFNYEKSLQSQWSNLTDLQKEAIQHHQVDGKMGFAVPTNTMSFIFVSNIQLPTDDDVRKAREKSVAKASLLAHKNAIRSRCMVQDFKLNDDTFWGWIADVILNTDCLSKYNISDEDKLTILDFIWDNWFNLTERSIRLVEKMSFIMLEYPEIYKSVWEIDFLK